MATQQKLIPESFTGGRYMTTPELLTKLALKFRPPIYAFLSEVRNSTGYARSVRTADAMAMSLWPSRGLHLIGFELKVSRGDWIHELGQPEKAESIMKYCDMWYLVVSEGFIVQPDELPTTWGLMIANGRGGAVRTIVKAPQLDPEPLDRLMLAGLLRNTTAMYEDWIPRSDIADELEAARENGAQGRDYEVRNIKDERDQLAKAIADFKTASGIGISRWSCGDIGEAVQFVLDGKHQRPAHELARLKETALRLMNAIDTEIKICGIDIDEAAK